MFFYTAIQYFYHRFLKFPLMFGKKKTHEHGTLHLHHLFLLYGDIPMLGGQTPHYCWPKISGKNRVLTWYLHLNIPIGGFSPLKCYIMVYLTVSHVYFLVHKRFKSRTCQRPSAVVPPGQGNFPPPQGRESSHQANIAFSRGKWTSTTKLGGVLFVQLILLQDPMLCQELEMVLMMMMMMIMMTYDDGNGDDDSWVMIHDCGLLDWSWEVLDLPLKP